MNSRLIRETRSNVLDGWAMAKELLQRQIDATDGQIDGLGY